MGICWSDPPVQPPRQPVYIVDKASAPPYYPPQPQYTYAVPYQQQQMYLTPYQQQQQQQMYAYYQPRPQQPQQNGIGTGTAVLGGFVLGSVVNEMLDPTE